MNRVDKNTIRAYVASRLGEIKNHSYGYDQYFCPFHSDGSSPSFTVYNDHFYCFGCQKKGSIIDFVMEYDNVDFYEAINRITGGGQGAA